MYGRRERSNSTLLGQKVGGFLNTGVSWWKSTPVGVSPESRFLSQKEFRDEMEVKKTT